MKKLAIITSHPIQYHAPWFRILAERNNIKIKVFYTWSQAKEAVFDPGFNKNRAWDIPLLEGYEYCFVHNVSSNPGSHHFRGIDNPSLIRETENWAPDAILIFGWSFISHLKVLRYFKGKIQILFRGDSTLLDEPSGWALKKMGRRLLLSWVYSHVNKVLYVGTANRQYYKAHGLKEKQLLFAPHAVDNLRFTQTVEEDQRALLGIPINAVVFIFTGKFQHKKDPKLLIEAFMRLEDETAHLLMVGDGELTELLRDFVSRQIFSISRRVHFLPFQNQNQMPGVYRIGNVFVLPSQGPGETWGLSVNEAMACSLPILVSNKCGCAEDLVEEGENGFVFRHSDAEDLKKKMKLCLDKQDKLKQMGQRSRQIIDSWSFDHICNTIEDALK